jgi:hypothetical protein
MKVEAGMGGPSLMRKAIETASGLTFAKAAALATKLFTKAVAADVSPDLRKETAAGSIATDTTTAGTLACVGARGEGGGGLGGTRGGAGGEGGGGLGGGGGRRDERRSGDVDGPVERGVPPLWPNMAGAATMPAARNYRTMPARS